MLEGNNNLYLTLSIWTLSGYSFTVFSTFMLKIIISSELLRKLIIQGGYLKGSNHILKHFILKRSILKRCSFKKNKQICDWIIEPEIHTLPIAYNYYKNK